MVLLLSLVFLEIDYIKAWQRKYNPSSTENKNKTEPLAKSDRSPKPQERENSDEEIQPRDEEVERSDEEVAPNEEKAAPSDEEVAPSDEEI